MQLVKCHSSWKLNGSVGVNEFLHNSVVTRVFRLKYNLQKNKMFTGGHVFVNIKWD
jgi:hypothetical protein